MSMFWVESVAQVTLIGASCYGLYALPLSDNPYGYTAAAFCLIHGLLSLVHVFRGDEECSRSFFVSTGIVDVIPLPLANIELYLQSSKSDFALVHGLSLILVIYDMMGNLGDDFDNATQMVKDLSLLGNIGSATYLGINEENYFHVGIAVSAFLDRFGALLINLILPEFGPQASTMNKAAIIGLMTYSLTNK